MVILAVFVEASIVEVAIVDNYLVSVGGWRVGDKGSSRGGGGVECCRRGILDLSSVNDLFLQTWRLENNWIVRFSSECVHCLVGKQRDEGRLKVRKRKRRRSRSFRFKCELDVSTSQLSV